MIALRTYQQLEDAWLDGVEAWCRAAPDFVLGGGRAWLVTVSDGQANWIKHRLLQAQVSLFGVQFLDARALRRELCQRFGLPAQALGAETLEFLLRLRALAAEGEGSSRSAAVARHPGTCLGALDDCAAAGWLGEPGLLDEILPDELLGFLPELQALDAWTPHLDARLAVLVAPLPPPAPPLSVCVFGWDAGYWPLFNLLQAAARAAGGAYLFMPAPRGTSETLQLSWLEACEAAFQEDFEPCDASPFESAQSALTSRLEGSSLAELSPGDAPPAPPELLTGVDGDDTAALVCDFAARWLLTHAAQEGDNAAASERLAILCPGRTPSAVAAVRALVAAGIRVEDELGEIAETGLPVQIQRAILDYHQDRGGLDGLLTLVELLNGYAATLDAGVRAPLLREVCPLDPVEVRQALHTAFAEVQHHDTRVLCDALSFARARVAGPLRRLIVHLENWPETLPWREALRRWCEGLGALGVPIDDLEPLWSQLQGLPVPDPVPSEAFFRYLSAVLVGASARRSPGAAHRFARVVVTTLEGAAGQTWGGVVLLDSNEGSWPLYPPENPFFDDGMRARLNVRRAEREPAADAPRAGYLLTSADRAQLEHFRFLETLENCTGPLAFASVTRAPADTKRELYPNEWLLRCLVESGGGEQDGRLLDRWHASVRHAARPARKLPAAEGSHLREVHARRRDPAAPFDEHFFNFQSLTGPDELPWAEPWSAGELDAVWNRPATFALSQVFGALPWRDKGRDLARGESWVVGRLVHRWVQTALGLSREPRRFDPPDWRAALDGGLRRAQTETEAALRVSLARAHRHGPAPDEFPLWWQGTLRKAAWAARRCLESLAEIAQGEHESPAWLCLERPFRAELSTHDGPLRLQARCDLVLLDRPELAGASCQLIDIRTGAAPATGALKPGDVQSGRGLGLAALLFLARAEGAEAAQTRAGVVHPDASNVGLVDDQSATGLSPVLDLLARQQRTLVFGQKGALTDPEGHGATENLPLATVPVDPSILCLKAEQTAGASR